MKQWKVSIKIASLIMVMASFMAFNYPAYHAFPNDYMYYLLLPDNESVC